MLPNWLALAYCAHVSATRRLLLPRHRFSIIWSLTAAFPADVGSTAQSPTSRDPNASREVDLAIDVSFQFTNSLELPSPDCSKREPAK
jgi:hypothetical protein